jgi:eukaryotic-like serine/threonine-protein kinase
MALNAGVRLGPYEVLGAIGAGGMGEVYKARDTRLDRTVAIKTLPPRFAEDPQFRDRFEREAKSVSQLSHPNICTLYDVGQATGSGSGPIHFLVLEYLEGETLASRLRRGALPLSDALKVGSELASALERAHRQGVVHRDLKPANIMLTKTGAKLLDFGLAKIGPPGAFPSVAAATLPTEVATITTQGTILGTLQYMAPEQIEGGAVDTRTDLFALGAVLYEMLTGRTAFQGTSQASLLSAILKDDPPAVSQLRAIPPGLDSLVRSCLAKDPEDRIQTAHDVWLQLKWIAESPTAAVPAAVGGSGRLRERTMWAAVAIACAAIASATTWWLKPAADHTHFAERSQFVLPDIQSFSAVGRRVVAISPDGTKMVYAANRQLYLRALNEIDAQPIRGTADVSVAQEPVFSPDGQWIAYFAADATSAGGRPLVSLKRVAVTGGAPVTLSQLEGAAFGVSWRNGMILVGRGPGGIDAIPEGGGAPRNVVRIDPNMERAVQPALLEDGRHVVFAVPRPIDTGRETASGEGPIVVQPIDGGPRKVLVERGASPQVILSRHLVYIHDGTILAVPFDSTRLEVTGSPVPLVEGVALAGQSSAGQFAISRTGTLVYLPTGYASNSRQLVWVDRKGGREESLAAAPGSYQQPRLSPDGRRFVVSLAANIWIWFFGSETFVRLTNESAVQYNPAWTPDGRSIVYDSNDGSGVQILRRAADGTGAADVVAPIPAGYPEIVSSDQKFLIYHPMERVAMLLPLNPKGPARPLLPDVKGQVSDAEISPDGRWIAYESNESGRFQVNVRPFPPELPGRWQISSNGGQHPLWSRNGRELFFLAGDGMMMSVPIQPGSIFTHEKPSQVFPAGQYYYNVARNYEVSVDGTRFLMIKNAARPDSRPSIIIVHHWTDEVRAKMAGRN